MSNGSTIIPGSYTCLCNFGYYVPNQTLQGFEGRKIETGIGNFTCTRCPGGCSNCDENGQCNLGDGQDSTFSMETLLRASIGAILGASMLCCLVLGVIVFRQRKCKVMPACSRVYFDYIFSHVYLTLIYRQLPVECGQY